LTLGERIKKARKTLDLTQRDFGARIGTTQNAVASYEIGRREPSAAAINNICKTFNISETWLRTGGGDMFMKRSRDEELTAFVNDLLAQESTDFRRRLVAALSRLNEDQWVCLESVAKTLMGEDDAPEDPHVVPVMSLVPKFEPDSEPSLEEKEKLLDLMEKDISDMTDEEYTLYTQEVRRQALAEREAEANARASPNGLTWRKKA